MEYREIINARRLAFGPQDRLMTMAAIKYKWAEDVYETMENNTWFPKSIAMGDDKLCYRTSLSEREKNAYDKALAFLSNLDGIQFNNLITNIGLHITAPEISLCIARQAAEEGVHVRSYQLMVEAVSMDPEAIYMMFQRDGMLARKNDYIMRASDVLKDEPTPANFARAIVGNLLLEGVFFYSGFLTFYALAKSGKMTGSADMIKYINRDEGGTHLELFAHMHDTFKDENPHLYDRQFYLDAERMFRDAVGLEIGWGKYIIQGGFGNLTDPVVENYIKHLGNERWRLISPDGRLLYPGVTNPCAWVDDFAKVNGGKANFFERKVTSYSVGGLDW